MRSRSRRSFAKSWATKSPPTISRRSTHGEKETHDSRKKRAMSSGAIQKDPVRADSARTKGKLGEVLPIPRPAYKPTTEPDWRKVAAAAAVRGQAAQGRAQRRHRPDGPDGLRRPVRHGRADQSRRMDRLAKEGLTYTNFHVNQPVLAQPHGAADRAQSAPEQHGRRRGTAPRLIPAIRACARRASPRSARSCRAGATAPSISARATRRRKTR